jgi:hypothetical protein
MAFIVAHDPCPAKLAELPILEVIGRVMPHRVVQEVIARQRPRRTRSGKTRCRKLPGEVVVLLLVAWYLLPSAALDLALATVLMGIRVARPELATDPATRSGICHARARWGMRPMIDLFRMVCHPLATVDLPGAFLFGLRVMAFDSTQEDLADTPANERTFGRHKSQHGPSAFPQLLGVYLVECGTRAIVAATIRSCHTSVHRAVRALLPRVDATMLVLWDCGFHSYPLAVAIRQREAHFLGRVPAGQTFVLDRRLADGTYLAWLYAAPPSRRTTKTPRLLVRVLVYTITDPARPGHGRTHRLMTSLLDPQVAPALALICAYHERWEIELALDEIDTHLRLAPGPLRSETPAGVLQEVYGLLLAHYAVRALISEAAEQGGIDPDRISFVHAVRLITVLLPFFQLLPPEHHPVLHALLLHDLARYQLPEREHRLNPRAVKRPWSKHRVRPRGAKARQTHLAPFADVLAVLPVPDDAAPGAVLSAADAA